MFPGNSEILRREHQELAMPKATDATFVNKVRPEPLEIVK